MTGAARSSSSRSERAGRSNRPSKRRTATAGLPLFAVQTTSPNSPTILAARCGRASARRPAASDDRAPRVCRWHRAPDGCFVFLEDREPLLPAADVVVGGAFRQVIAQQVQVVGMAVEPFDRLVEFPVRAEDPELPQQGAGGGGIERMQGVTQAGAAGVLEGDQVRNVGAAGQDAQARIVHGQSAQQGLHRRVLELAAEATGRLLERLQAVEHQERPLGGDQFGELPASWSTGPSAPRRCARTTRRRR